MKKNHPTYHKGFTLIELLVVVAIIALLAATILASLGSARTKAKDARTQSELASMRAQAELYNSDHSFSYGSVTGTASLATCTLASTLFDTSSAVPNTVAKLMTDVLANASGAPTTPDVTCANTSTTWVVAAKLQAGTYSCVDSNGISKVYASTYASSSAVVSGGHCL